MAILQKTGITGSLSISSSGIRPTTSASLFSVNGYNGRLLNVVDTLSGSLFSVNTIAGLPVFEVFSNNRVVAGKYNANDFVISGSRVGIGTNSPSTKTHIVDSADSPALGTLRVKSTGGNSSICIDCSSTSQYAYFTLAQGNVGKFEMGVTPTTSDFYLNSSVQVGASGASIYIKKADGNVGISNTSPTSKLDVTGTVTATSFTGAGTGLTGTAASLNIGGNAATATTAANVNNGTLTISAGTGIGIGTTTTFTANQSTNATITLSNTGVTSAVGTTNQVNVSAATGAVTFSLPQSIHTAATPTFSGLTLTSLKVTGAGGVASNTATGVNALGSNTTGVRNTAFGVNALKNNITNLQNTAFGYKALYNNTGGTSDQGNYNAGFGDYTLTANTIGYFNLAMGAQALKANTVGYENMAIGANTLLSNISGKRNTGCGASALRNNLADANCAFGYRALQANTTGTANDSFGYQSLFNNTSGVQNTGFGFQTIAACVTGIRNCAFGYRALRYTTGNGNSAFGFRALFSCTTNSNSAFGSGSLWKNTTGRQNTAVGGNAGSTITTGANLSVFGYNAQASTATATNEITLGNASVATLRCNTTSITSLSDFRDKTDIKTLVDGLKIIDRVRPVTFRWDKREWYPNGIRDGSRSDTGIQVGFIAQELKEMMQKTNADYLNLVYEVNPDKLEATPQNLFIPLIKAVQELHEKVKALESVIYNKN